LPRRFLKVAVKRSERELNTSRDHFLIVEETDCTQLDPKMVAHF